MSCESNLKDAVIVCLPLIHAAIRDIEKGTFPKSFLLNIEIPSCPLTNKVCFLCCYVIGLCASIVIWVVLYIENDLSASMCLWYYKKVILIIWMIFRVFSIAFIYQMISVRS